MNEREYDLLLAETAGELPPPPEEQAEPWSRAMKYILWGLALVTFRLELFYLQFILPCIGSGLVFLGFRSLRRSARGFAAAYAASAILLVMDALGTAANAVRPEYFGALGYFTFAANIVLKFTLLFGLRSGIRTAFSATSGERRQDLSFWVAAAYAGVVLIALLETLVPARDDEDALLRVLVAAALYIALLALLRRLSRRHRIAPAERPQDLGLWAVAAYAGVVAIALLEILTPAQSNEDSWLRALAAAALYIALLVLLRRQGRALAGRGYRIAPAPVRLSARVVFALYALAIAVLLVSALLLGPRLKSAEAEPFETAETAQARAELVEQGMPEWLAGSLTEAELELCDGASEVQGVVVEEKALETPDAERLELGVWAVYLADGRTRFYAAFRWLEPPRFKLQEALRAEPDGNEAVSDFAACLLYTKDGEELAAPLEVSLGGGLKAEELGEFGLFWNEHSLEKLGHTQYEPYVKFSMPFGAEDVHGWLAYTYDAGVELEGSGTVFGTVVYYHQSTPQYPFADLSDSVNVIFGDKSWLRSSHYCLL